MHDGPVELRRLVEHYLAERRFMEARVLSKKGEQAFPWDHGFLLLLARAHELDGRPEEAIEVLSRVPADSRHRAEGDLVLERMRRR